METVMNYYKIEGNTFVEASQNTDRISNFPQYLATLGEEERIRLGYYSEVEYREGVTYPFVENGKIIAPKIVIDE